MADERIVHEFRKGPGEIVRATIGEYRGRRTVGIRIFYEDVSGEWKPTRKGITITSDLFTELKKAVDLIYSGLEEEAEESEPAAPPETPPPE